MTSKWASTIGIRPCLDIFVNALMPNPRKAWGQTLQIWQRTQADDPGLSVPWGRRHRKLSAGSTIGGIICLCIQNVGYSIELVSRIKSAGNIDHPKRTQALLYKSAWMHGCRQHEMCRPLGAMFSWPGRLARRCKAGCLRLPVWTIG
jgi:hypothetical protein